MNLYNLRKKEEETWANALGTFFGHIFGLALNVWLFMVCWNYLVTSMFHLPSMGFWQAGAAVVLLGYLKGK